MELVTGAMGSLLPKLGELLKEEYGLQKGVRKKIQSLSRELEAAHAVLRKIGDVPPEELDELVRLWARDVREASYDMEDIVDTFLVRVDDGTDSADAHRLRRLRKKVGGLFKKSKARRKISCLIQDITQKLEEVAARRGRYTADSIVAKPAAATTIDPRILNLYKRATQLVGMEGPKDELISMLSLGDDVDVPDKKMKIVSVVGFGGLGKTTLAKAVYDHIKLHFERGAFVPVGRNPDVKKVLRDILIDLDKGKYANSDLMVLDEKQLIDELEEFVKEKRCFIVIDDIWDKESWNLIRCALQDSNCGSRVVVTTRISEVAAHADEVYKIQPLSSENSEKLLYERIADGKGKCFDSPSVEACERILKKCGGVPLAIITIASLLASKPWEDWSEVYNSIGFGHGGNDEVENTRKILLFSYYDLPSHLKPCLLYLSIFSEDQGIEIYSLIWKWIAEGFVHEEQAAGIGLYELGERYFNELINRSMIQPVEMYVKGYVEGCRLHDMVFDLVRSLSSQENFVTVLDGDDERLKLPGSIARRLVLQRIKEHSGGQLLANIAVDKVRSFIASECNFSSSASCPRTPVLRVLDMQNCYTAEKIHEGMLERLGSLLHLRYLRLGAPSTSVSNIELPREVRYLKFLQTLDLWEFGINELPEEVGLLTQLVCLRLNLETRVPAGLIGKLTLLQELVWFPTNVDANVARTMQFVKELGMLRELGVLWTQINVTSESMERALLESLGNLHNIRMMHINGSTPQNGNSATSHEGFITCRHLQYLHLNCFVFSRLPKWIKSSLAPNLSYLYVRVQVVKGQDIETLARLPELRSLTLKSCDETEIVNIKIPCTSQDVGYYFRKLRILKIHGAPIWFDLGGCDCHTSVVAPATMPSLESLEFKVCVRLLKDAALHSFDKLLGFESLGRTSLQVVTVTVNCKGARILDVDDVEDALERTAAVHPKRPNLRTTWQEEEMLSPYQEARMDVSRTPDFVMKAWKSADIIDSGHIRALRILQDPEASSTKVLRLLYAIKGKCLLTLSSNAILKLWKWGPSEKNSRGKPTTSVPPLLWQPEEGILMKNDTTKANLGEAAGCIALHKKERYIISSSGGKVSLFDTNTFKVITTFMAPPRSTTFITVHPQNKNIIAIGMEDSSIQIYDIKSKVRKVLTGHQKKITGLTFLQSMNVLVSSGADAQLCVWSTGNWEKKKSRYIRPPSNGSALVGDTMVQFHYNQTHLLVVHESQLTIYDGNLECLHLWSPKETLSSAISSAVYSSDGLMVYAGFRDGAIGIFEAESLRLRCRIAPSAYVTSSVPSGGGIVYPMDVAANPWYPNLITVGMSDGAVHVLEPLED
ncbi:disease resistance protein Pik-2-like isoform X5 [Panicum virgatum]|uniref:disease resistance protein Pik-2-like isoform X5 n=1 Tax=Panicum virgatum TaxID=38727 RepID=UPI0019D55052|nr:disease resistance protein Pik-2-like isoform X5 [Panicum virgatum]